MTCLIIILNILKVFSLFWSGAVHIWRQPPRRGGGSQFLIFFWQVGEGGLAVFWFFSDFFLTKEGGGFNIFWPIWLSLKIMQKCQDCFCFSLNMIWQVLTVFSRAGQSQGLLYKHLCHSLIHSFIKWVSLFLP